MLGLIFFIFLVLGTGYGFDPASYAHHEKILPQYEIFWTVNQQDLSLSLALHVQTTGWVGFGIAEITSGRCVQPEDRKQHK
jgi:hypothetical protein